MKLYKTICLILMVLFGVTGLLFLVIPDQVLVLFNNISSNLGMEQSPVVRYNFYIILAAGYMYLVTLLAFLMYRNPDNRQLPLLLAHGKLASSFLSLILFLTQGNYLIFLANFVIDGLIGIVVTYYYLKMGKKPVWASF